jgi:hypothetical protein
MDLGWRGRWDPLAAGAAGLALIMIGVLVRLANAGDQPAGWFVAALALAALLTAYGVARAAPRRGVALAVAGVVMVLLGLLGILSVGFPILVAGVLALIAAGVVSASAHPRAEVRHPRSVPAGSRHRRRPARRRTPHGRSSP